MGWLLKRLLLPIAGALFTIPPFYPDILMNYIALPACYFLGSYFTFLNFPSILQDKPLYIKDLKDEHDNRFEIIYIHIMNVILATVFAVATESIFLHDTIHKPTVEIIAIAGGTYSFYMKLQDIIGKGLLHCCFYMKENDRRRSESLLIT